LAQVRRHTLEEHDEKTRNIMTAIGSHIEARAAGGEVHPALAEEIARLETSNCDESCGEGWHRGSQHEKVRAYASSSAHLKFAVRRKGAFGRVKTFRTKFGERGVAVIRYEWRNYKRILAKIQRPWTPKKVSFKEVVAKVYREDRSNELNWTTVVAREPGLHAAPPETADNTTSVQNEYIRSQVKPGGYYGVQVDSQEEDVSGVVVPVQRHVVFRVLGTSYGQHRAHVMPTVDDMEDTDRVAHLAIEVVFHDPRGPSDDDAPLPAGAVKVFRCGDPQWVRPTDLAPFATLKTALMHYLAVEASAEVACLVLSNPTLAVPPQPLLDAHCPVVKLMDHLNRVGWRVALSKIVHTTTDVWKV